MIVFAMALLEMVDVFAWTRVITLLTPLDTKEDVLLCVARLDFVADFLAVGVVTTAAVTALVAPLTTDSTVGTVSEILLSLALVTCAEVEVEV